MDVWTLDVIELFFPSPPQHLDPTFYEAAQTAVLKSVHMVHLQLDLDKDLSDHCGSTTPDGIKK